MGKFEAAALEYIENSTPEAAASAVVILQNRKNPVGARTAAKRMLADRPAIRKHSVYLKLHLARYADLSDCVRPWFAWIENTLTLYWRRR